MSPRRDSKKAGLSALLGSGGLVDGTRFRELKSALEPVSESYLRKLLRDSGVPLAPEVEGVSASSFESLERTLLALAEAYGGGAREVRKLVIEAKNHLRWAERKASDESRRAERREMLLWVMTWLENPSAFPVWLPLRKRAKVGVE
jgi:hypothetical protein